MKNQLYVALYCLGKTHPVAAILGPVDFVHFTYNNEFALHRGKDDPFIIGVNEDGEYVFDGMTFSDVDISPNEQASEFEGYEVLHYPDFKTAYFNKR